MFCQQFQTDVDKIWPTLVECHSAASSAVMGLLVSQSDPSFSISRLFLSSSVTKIRSIDSNILTVDASSSMFTINIIRILVTEPCSGVKEDTVWKDCNLALSVHLHCGILKVTNLKDSHMNEIEAHPAISTRLSKWAENRCRVSNTYTYSGDGMVTDHHSIYLTFQKPEQLYHCKCCCCAKKISCLILRVNGSFSHWFSLVLPSC